MRHDFNPSRWLRNGHVQTLRAVVPPPASTFARVRGEPIRLPLPGGSALIARASWARGTRPTAVLVHGVGGSSESPYMLRAGLAFLHAGYHVVRLNLRGAGEGVELATSIYHAGLTDDIDVALRALARDPRVAGLFLVGFSLGGSLVLKLAGEWGAAPPRAMRAAATLSAPTDFMAVSDALEALAKLPYHRFILEGVVRQAAAFARRHPRRVTYDLRDLRGVRTIREYDRQVMVPMHGFDDVRHYYESTSAAPWLGAVRLPTLLVHAEDDPIIPARTVAPTLRGLAPAFQVAWTEHGGHVGWFSRAAEEECGMTWPVRRVLGFFEKARRRCA